VTAALAVVLGTADAGAKGGVASGAGNEFFLTNSWSPTADVRFYLGALDDYRGWPDVPYPYEYVVGDWDGDGADAIALREGQVFQLRNALEAGPIDHVVVYGRPLDTVLVGDWNGDRVDTFAVRRGRTYYVRNSLSSGADEFVGSYGRDTDEILVGDWDGDGTDTLAVRRGRTYYFKDDLAPGSADRTQTFGRATDEAVAGDWDGDGVDTLGVRRGNRYYLTNSFDSGPAESVVSFGRATDGALVGDWNDDGADTLGVRRPAYAIRQGTHQVGVGVAPGTYRTTTSPFNECSWERLAALGGEPGENVIASGATADPIVTISASDVAFHSECPPWYPVEATYPFSPWTRFDHGTYVVGRHIEPGTYRATDSGICTWARLSGFSGTAADVIETSGEDASGTVTIQASDVGFSSAWCGFWERD
jgi:hypothetical protein